MPNSSLKGTHFYHEDGTRLGDDLGVVAIPLYKGMKLTISGHAETFEVVDWSYHHGRQDEEPGLKIVLRSLPGVPGTEHT